MSSNGNIFRITGPLCGEFTGPGEFPTQRPVTWSFDVFFELRLNKRLSKQPWGWWFETPPWSLWRQCNVGERFPILWCLQGAIRMQTDRITARLLMMQQSYSSFKEALIVKCSFLMKIIPLQSSIMWSGLTGLKWNVRCPTEIPGKAAVRLVCVKCYYHKCSIINTYKCLPIWLQHFISLTPGCSWRNSCLTKV